MEDYVYKQMAQLQENHWWFVSRRRAIDMLLHRYLYQDRGNIILDMGCGTGSSLAALSRSGRVIGLDINEYTLGFAKRRGGASLLKADALSLPFADNRFDAVICSDLLYHKMVTDDNKALDEIFRACKRGGILLVFEPAFEWLRSPHDMAEHTRHRYTLDELCLKIIRAGFRLKKSSYHLFFLFPVISTVRFFKRLFLRKNFKSDLFTLPGPINRILSAIMGIENRLLRKIDFPIGSTAICVAVK